MQRAARKVAQENERLRMLLARHGIAKEEVDSFLGSFEQTEVLTEQKTPMLLSRSSSASNQYPTNPGPGSLRAHPLIQDQSRQYGSYPSPKSRQPVQIPRQNIQSCRPATNCAPAAQCSATTQSRPTPCGPAAKTRGSPLVKATTTSTTSETRRQVESYYASPTETQSSLSPRPQEDVSPSTYIQQAPAIAQSQGCCPPSKPQTEVIMEDPSCPSTEDCFCPPTATVPPPTDTRRPGTDEMSCETAATIISQMRGDSDNTSARASLGCAPGEMCSIKNAFLMQVLDER